MNRLNGHLEQHNFAYLTTSGRVSAEPHRIEIWFVIVDGLLWVNSGGGRRSDWVKNLINDPRVVVEVGEECWSGNATILDDFTQHPARERLAARYQGWSEGLPLSDWATTSLLVRVEVDDDC